MNEAGKKEIASNLVYDLVELLAVVCWAEADEVWKKKKKKKKIKNKK